MGYTRLQSASGQGTTTATATFGSNASSGTKIIAFIASANNVTPTTVQDAALNNLTLIGSVQGSTGGNVSGYVYAMDTPAGDVGITPAIKVTFGAAFDVAIVVLEVSGLLSGNTTAMADGSAGTSQLTPAASQAQPAYSSTASGEMLFSFLGDNGNTVTYALTGYTLDANSVNGSATADCVVGWKNSTNGAESGTWAATGTPTGSALIVVAFKLAPVTASAPALPLQGRPQPQPPRPAPSQIISAPVAYRPVVTLSGTGTLTTTTPGVGGQPQLITGIAQPPQPAQPPAARLIGLTTAAFVSAATLSGSGTLTAAPTLITSGLALVQAPPPPPQPAQPPPGQITGSAPIITFTVGATLSGTGTLTTSTVVSGIPPYVVSPVVQAPQPPAPPPARIFTGQAAVVSGATLTGTGTLAAAPYFDATGTVLSGTGTLTAGPGVGGFPVVTQQPLAQPLQPPRPPPSQIIQAPPAILLGSATLTGSGTLAAAPFFSAAAALSGTGTLTASYTVAGAQPYVITTVIQPPQPPQPPPGRLFTAPAITLLGAATLTGSGTLSAVETISIAAALSGTGTLSASYIGPPGFTVGTLTATTAPGATSGGTLTASTQRTGGPS